MRQSKKINGYMYNLLIERGIDDFSVIELRDALMTSAKDVFDPEEARKYVYRQIFSFERKGWLTSTGYQRAKRYQKTTLFKQINFYPRSVKYHLPTHRGSADKLKPNNLALLLQEKTQHEGELVIVLSEVEEYRSLISRFPQNRDQLLPLFTDAKECSARLHGKIKAVTNALKVAGFRGLGC